MTRPGQDINEDETLAGEDWCQFHVLVTIVFVSWYNLWATIWTHYLEEIIQRDIHKWLELFCPKWYCQKGQCPAWCDNINQVCNEWMYTHQIFYFNIIIIFYFVTIQPAILHFTSRMISGDLSE